MVDLPITKWIKKKIRRLIAIVEDTDVATHSIASGKYVVWKGDLCKSTESIAVGGLLSLSNLSPVSDGGLNELSEQIGTINGKLMCSGYMEWNDITSSSGSWATNTGYISNGVKPSGNAQSDSYNLLLDIAGTYLVIYHAEIADDTNKTGLRGIRQYVTETNIHEFFFAPSGHDTICEASCIVHSNGYDTVRMGVYQASGGSLTVKNIRVMAVMLQRD